MSDESLIDEFFSDVRRRAPAKRALHKGPTPERMDSVEENLVHATMGFGFKCGICGKKHKSSHREKVKGLAICIGKIVKEFGDSEKVWRKKRYGTTYGNKESSSGLGVRFLPEPATADTIVFTFRQYNAFSAVRPRSGAFSALYPKTVKKFDEFSKRLDEIFNREVIEEISLKEALGAPSTIHYLRARQTAFRERALAEFAKIKADQEAADPAMFALARDWKKGKPERFKIGKIERGYGDKYKIKKWFNGSGPSAEPIHEIEINGTNHGGYEILGWFDRISGHPVWDSNNAQSTVTVLFDMGLVEGFPAISWGIITAKDEGGAKRTAYKASTLLNFVTLWNGKMYLNMDGRNESFSLKSFENNKYLVPVSPERGSLVLDSAEGSDNES
jgi:hypothetical protein